MSLSATELEFIRDARLFLENPSFLIRTANLMGKPIEKGLRMLPSKIQTKIHDSVRVSMEKGLQVVTKSVTTEAKSFDLAQASSKKNGLFHSLATFGTGAVGGFFGVLSLPVELPLTTAIMLRSIVATAADFGHDISSSEVQLECLYVLALGSAEKDPVNSTYFTSRVAFMDLIRIAAKDFEAPLIARLLARIASRFEMVVSEKALAELMPVVGAIGGGAINAAFSDHFNTAARFHFGLRALEKKVGSDAVRSAYEGVSG